MNEGPYTVYSITAELLLNLGQPPPPPHPSSFLPPGSIIQAILGLFTSLTLFHVSCTVLPSREWKCLQWVYHQLLILCLIFKMLQNQSFLRYYLSNMSLSLFVRQADLEKTSGKDRRTLVYYKYAQTNRDDNTNNKSYFVLHCLVKFVVSLYILP